MLAHRNAQTGEEVLPPHELVRLAIPRRTYTQSHMDYVLEVIESVWRRREAIAGVRIVTAPCALRHFRAKFERLPLPAASPAAS